MTERARANPLAPVPRWQPPLPAIESTDDDALTGSEREAIALFLVRRSNPCRAPRPAP